MASKQRKHIRRSKTGKPFVAGRGRAKQKTEISAQVKREVLKEHADEISKQLKRQKKARLPDVGMLRLKIKPASKGGKKVEAFGKTYVTKARPRRAVVRFTASKALREALA